MISPYELSQVERNAAEDISYQRTIAARTTNWPAIFASVRRLAKRKTMSNHEIAMHILQCGSTYGWRFCVEHGIDPEARTLPSQSPKGSE